MRFRKKNLRFIAWLITVVYVSYFGGFVYAEELIDESDTSVILDYEEDQEMESTVVEPESENDNQSSTEVALDSETEDQSEIFSDTLLADEDLLTQGQVIQTIYPTKDYVISDFIVTDYGAVPDDGADDTAAFQAAIDAAANARGGVVFVPTGVYQFNGNINIKSGVTLRGDWANPTENDGKVLGTILAVYTNKGNANAASFIRMQQGTGITNLSIWYPEQTLNNVQAYPWSIEQVSGNSATIENVTMVNSYQGFKSSPSELHYLTNSYITALYMGSYIDMTTDIGRLENVTFSPDFWPNSGLPGSPDKTALFNYMTSNAEGIVMGRSDWEYMDKVYISGYKVGMRLTTNAGGESANAQFYQMHIQDCNIAFLLDSVNSYGLLVSDSSFKGGVGTDSMALYASNKFSTIAQFNTVDFEGGVTTDGSGVISFENCTFDRPGDGYALTMNWGSVLLGQTSFRQPDHHVFLGEAVLNLSSVNSGYNRELAVTDNSLDAEVEINTGDQYVIETLPSSPQTDISIQPKPATDKVFKITEAPYNADNTGSQDVADVLRLALQDAKEAGGGTVYLPAGIYLVNSPIVIPEGVELRGTWDVQHHTNGGGTAIFTEYGLNDESANSLIILERSSGIRGMNIYQKNQHITNYKPCPYLIQGQGSDVYLINITLPNAYKGVDLGSYNTSRHYVEYLAGSPLKVGIYVGGGSDSGIVRNVQFNPHYWLRNSNNQEYTLSDMDVLWEYQKNNLDAFRLGNVTNEVVFNSFVYGSLYGIHFIPENGTGPDAIVIGHGTDGSKKGVLIDAIGAEGVVMINTELVSLSSNEKAYITTGPDFHSSVTLFNSAMWGDVDHAVDVNQGTLRIQQANFAVVGQIGINSIGGKAYVYDSYFQQGNRDHVNAGQYSEGVEITNNLFKGGVQYSAASPGKVTGTNVKPLLLEITKDGSAASIKLTNIASQKPVSGYIEILQPTTYMSMFLPVHFEAITYTQSVSIPLPYIGGDMIRVRIVLDDGQSYNASANMGITFADRYGTRAGTTPAIVADTVNRYTSINGSWKGTDDLSLTGDVKWDDDNLFLHLVVTDNVHYNEKSNDGIWDGDSIQLGIDMAKNEDGLTLANELGFALTNNNGVAMWRWSAPAGLTTGALNQADATIVRDEAAKTTTYEIRIPFSALYPADYTPDMSKLGLSILINDADDSGGRVGCLEYNPGINVKEYNLFGDLFLLEDGQYGNMLEESATNAVIAAELEKTVFFIEIAKNFIILLPDGAVKESLEARISNLGAIDKSMLQSLYDDVKGLTKDDFVSENAWNDFKAVLTEAKAILENPNATQNEVDASYEKLAAALDNLAKLNTIYLATAIEAAGTIELNLDKYVEAGKQEFREALLKAREVLKAAKEDTTDQEIIDQAVVRLNNAVNALRLRPDTKALEQLVKDAKDVLTNSSRYVEEGVNALSDALEKAEELIGKVEEGTVTQDAIDEAYNTLKAAIEALEEKVTDDSKEETKSSGDETKVSDKPTGNSGKKSGNPGSSSAPKTGDTMVFKAYFLLLVCSILLIGMITYKKRKSARI